jgi:hypothetical protein
MREKKRDREKEDKVEKREREREDIGEQRKYIIQ